MNHICSEIMYTRPNGDNVHSDLCFEADASVGYPAGTREVLHEALDEWLDNARGTGIFYVGMLPENKHH